MTNEPADARAQALAGVRVLDLSRVLAGPWCTQTLADLGADVIKVERPLGRAPRRRRHPRLGPAVPARTRDGADTAEAAYYLGTNRNKRSVTVDIAQPRRPGADPPAGRHGCDVLVENYKVGDMARYGLDAARCWPLNPRLVYCSVTGFGQTGPYRERAGYDYAIQGMGGLMSVTGERDDLPRRRPAEGRRGGGRPVHRHVRDRRDPGGAAPPRPHRRGPGDRHGAARHPGRDARQPRRQLPGHAASRRSAPAMRTRTSCRTRSSRSPTATSSWRSATTASSRKFCARRRPAGTARPTRASRATPTACATATRWCRCWRDRDASAPRADWLAALEAAKVPCGPINDLAEVFADPQVQARGMTVDLPHPLAGACAWSPAR